MFEKSHFSCVTGFLLEDDHLQGMVLSKRAGKIYVDGALNFNLTTQENGDKQLICSENDKKLLKQLADKSLIATSLESSKILTRSLQLNLVKESEIDSVIYFQAEPLVPYPIEEAIIDKITVKSEENNTLLTLLISKSSYVEDQIKLFRSLGLEPEVITSPSAALTAFCSEFIQQEEEHLVIHIGKKEITGAKINDHKLLGALSLKMNFDDLIEAFVKDSGQPKETLANAKKKQLQKTMPSFQKQWNMFLLEIKRIVLALSKEKKTRVLLTGYIVDYPALEELLYEEIAKEKLEIIQPEEVSLSQRKLKQSAIAIGSCLCALPGYRDQINFRQKEWSYPYPFKRTKWPLFSYITLSLIATAIIYFFGNIYCSYKTDHLRTTYTQLLSLARKPFSEFEKEYQMKSLGKKEKDVTIVNPIHFSSENIASRLNFLSKQTQSAPDTFPLFPDIPLVSDTLAWLSSHPHVKNKEENQGIRLLNFSYKMVKRPEFNKRKEKYQVKVELEFSAPTPTQAREFYDTLIAPNEIIDPKEEVKWNPGRGKYVTSFFLKDKTIYP